MKYKARIEELQAERARIWGEYTATVDGAKDGRLAGEDIEKCERMNADMNSLTREIDVVRAAGEREAADATDVTPEDRGDNALSNDPIQARAQYAEAFDAFMRNGVVDCTPAQRSLLQRAGTNGLSQKEQRALGILGGAAGGFTVPEGFLNKVTEVQKAYARIEDVANVITTDTGADLPWMTNDDTTNKGAILSENVQITDQDTTFGVVTLQAFMYTSKQVKVSLQLLQDSAVDLEGFLTRKFGMRLGRIHADHYTFGTGANQPKGLITGATLSQATVSHTAISFDDVINLIHKLDPAYRSSPDVRFMLHDAIVQQLRLLKDSYGRYLWTPSVSVDHPDMIWGYPYTVNQSMDSTLVTGKHTMLFGDFSAYYVIRKVRGITVLRLNERYADFLQVGFLAFDRCDGTVDDVNAAAVLTQ